MKCPLSAKWPDKVLVLADGVIIEEGSPQEVFTNPRHERCRSFLSKIL